MLSFVNLRVHGQPVGSPWHGYQVCEIERHYGHKRKRLIHPNRADQASSSLKLLTNRPA